MKAVVCRALDDPAGLSVETVPDPVPGTDQVLLDVHACGVNFADTLMIAGRYQERPELPFVPGLEVAGVVAEGADMSGELRPGTRVLARCGRGGFAERVAVDVADALAIPDAMPFTHAAAFAVAYGTAHVGLARRARLEPGETLLVHGAAGGVGLAAVEVGKALGATVIATASTQDKLARAREHGADHLVGSSDEDLRERVKALTGGRGADVVFDPVGGDLFDASLRCVAWEGRVLTVGFASGRIPSAPANLLLVKNVSVVGLFWGNYARFAPEVLRDSLGVLLRWYENGRLSPHVSATLPLERTGEALGALASRTSTGKVVVRVRADASGAPRGAR